MLFINRHPFALKSVHIIYNFNFLNIFHLFNCLLIGFKLKICFVLFIIYWSQLLFYLFYQIIRIIFTFRFVKHEFIVLLCVCVCDIWNVSEALVKYLANWWARQALYIKIKTFPSYINNPIWGILRRLVTKIINLDMYKHLFNGLLFNLYLINFHYN